MGPPRRRRRRLRLSVRALMALVLVTGGGLGWCARLAHIQRDAVAAIERAGGKAYYGWQLKVIPIPPDWGVLTIDPKGRPRWPRWVTDRVGPDFYSTVRMVNLPGEADPVMPHVGRLEGLEELDFLPKGRPPALGPTDAGMAHLRGLRQLKHLKLGVPGRGAAVGSRITGAGLAAIEGATRLQILQLQGCRLGDADLAALRGLVDLRMLTIDSPDVTDAGLAHLAGLAEMRRLDLEGTRITAAGLGLLRGMSRLEYLDVGSTRVATLEPCRGLPALTNLDIPFTPIDDAGLAPASSPDFPTLTHLNLNSTRITDAGLRHLRDVPKSGRLVLAYTAVTDAGLAAIRAARPGLRVISAPTPSPAPPAPPGR